MSSHRNLHYVMLACRSTPTEFLTCEKLFHCANGYDKFGVCIGGCKSGFEGEHCIEKGELTTITTMISLIIIHLIYHLIKAKYKTFW